MEAAFASDPDFAIEVKRGIAAGFVRAVAIKDGPEIIKVIVPELFAKFKEEKIFTDEISRQLIIATQKLASQPHSGSVISDQLAQRIGEAVEGHMGLYKEQLVRQAEKVLLEKQEELFDSIDARIQESIDQRIDHHIDQEVGRRLAERMASIGEVLEP